MREKGVSSLAINTNNLLDAVSIVADSIVQKYQYDQTIEAKIISSSQRAEGIYKVEYETAKFDAYSTNGQTYYENEVVYVMIPKGQWTNQKYIIGRKVDLQTDPGKTFNFKLPFDNFVTLNDLTQNTPFTNPKGFLANKPEHGKKTEQDNSYINRITALQDAFINDYYNPYVANLNHWKDIYDDVIETLQQQKATELEVEGVLLSTKTSTTYPHQTYEYLMRQAIHNTFDLNNNHQDVPSYYLFNVIQNYGTTFYTAMALTEEDYLALAGIALADYEEIIAKLQYDYLTAQTNYNNDLNAEFNDLDQYNIANQNHLWSWSRTVNDPTIETKLGIEIDVQTLLGSYRPSSGKYGLRIIVNGTLKATDDTGARDTIQEVYFTNEEMYGNTYGFYEPYAQQKIFDISNFLKLNRIDIFFWQDHDFKDVYSEIIPYQIESLDEYGQTQLIDVLPNINISGLNVKLGLTTDECLSDRVFLYTYDPLAFGYDPVTMDSSQSYATNNKILRFAWVHLTAEGPVLVNHTQPRGANDIQSLNYWNANIYWYHYELNCEQDFGNLPEKQGGFNWKILNPTYLTSGDDFAIKVDLDVQKAKEQFKALIIFSDDTFQTAEPLVFTNIDTTVETAALDALNEITFKVLKRIPADNEDGYKIVEEDSLSEFFVYDENNHAIKNSYNETISSVWYYIQIWARNNDTGEYLPMVYDPNIDDEFPVEIIWDHVPNTLSSMFAEVAEVGEEDLRGAILAPWLEQGSSNYNNRLKEITRKFRIKEYWDLNLQDNTFSAIIKRKNQFYHPTRDFHFGQSGTMGSEYTLSIVQKEPQGQSLVETQPFRLQAVVRDSQGDIVSNNKYTVTWELLSPTKITQSQGESISSYLSSQWNYSTTNCINDTIQGVIQDSNPPIFRITVHNIVHYPLTYTKGFSVTNSYIITGDYQTICATRLEFKSDGTVPVGLFSRFIVRRQDNNELIETYPDWYLKQSHRENTTWVDCDDYFGLIEYPRNTGYLNINQESGLQHIIIYAKPSGSVIDYGDTASFSSTSISGWIESEYYLIQDEIERLYNSRIQTAKERYGEQSQQYQTVVETQQEWRDTILLKLAIAAGTQINGYSEYALDAYVRNETTTSSWYWEESFATDYYTYIGYTIENGSAYFNQAIPLVRNVYSSSLLNTWDGEHLQIDEESNSILARMLAAGSKNSDNTFTGVILGNWAERGDSSLDIPGLYGLQNGEQTFGFKTDGTGFIGKSGRGRIVFDGNQSLISNVDKTAYINLDPITYYFDNYGNIHFTNYKGFSQYFLYAETKKTSLATIDGEDSLEQSTMWATRFMNNPDKDFFVVDPNNGILTTGGIIARYGKIGNWLISEVGLYQKYTGDDLASSRYMYLGYPGANGEDESDKYAIFAGYNKNNPLFTVNWKGYMSARAGKIGETSPWYISDEGLVQSLQAFNSSYVGGYNLTNEQNFNTIFLGDANAPSDITQWNTYNLDPKNVADLQLLPNDSTNNNSSLLGPKVFGTSDSSLSNATRGHFAIYAGGPTWQMVRQDSANNNLYLYRREFDPTPRIRFGVRTDGTLYAQQSQLGQWHIADSYLFSGPHNNDFTIDDDKLVIINSYDGQLALGQSFYADREGNLILSHSDGTNSEGYLTLADCTLEALSLGSPTIPSIGGFTSYTSGSQAISGTSTTSYGAWGLGGDGYSITIPAFSEYVTNADNTIDWDNVSQYSRLRLYTNGDTNLGVTLITGYKNGSSTSPAAIFYPSGYEGLLGTNDHRWDIFARYVSVNALEAINGNICALGFFQNGHYVATQAWVYDQLDNIWSALNDLSSRLSSISTTTGAGISGLNSGLASMGQFAQQFNGRHFLGTTEASKDNLGYTLGDLHLPYFTFGTNWLTSLSNTQVANASTSTNFSSQGYLSVNEQTSTSVSTTDYVIHISGKNIPFYLTGTSSYGTIYDFVIGRCLTKGGLDSEGTSFLRQKENDKWVLKLGLTAQIPSSSTYTESTGTVTDTVSISHTHKPEFSEDATGAEGKITLTLGDADFTKTTSDEATFNIKDLGWFKGLLPTATTPITMNAPFTSPNYSEDVIGYPRQNTINIYSYYNSRFNLLDITDPLELQMEINSTGTRLQNYVTVNANRVITRNVGTVIMVQRAMSIFDHGWTESRNQISIEKFRIWCPKEQPNSSHTEGQTTNTADREYESYEALTYKAGWFNACATISINKTTITVPHKLGTATSLDRISLSQFNTYVDTSDSVTYSNYTYAKGWEAAYNKTKVTKTYIYTPSATLDTQDTTTYADYTYAKGWAAAYGQVSIDYDHIYIPSSNTDGSQNTTGYSARTYNAAANKVSYTTGNNGTSCSIQVPTTGGGSKRIYISISGYSRGSASAVASGYIDNWWNWYDDQDSSTFWANYGYWSWNGSGYDWSTGSASTTGYAYASISGGSEGHIEISG